MMQLGRRWNESVSFNDPLAGRRVRRLTSEGLINQTPTYHTNSGFTVDGRFLVFVTVRDGATWVVRAEVETGELVALWRAPGLGDRNYIHRGMELVMDGLDGGGICGNRLCIAPTIRSVVFTCQRRLLAVSLDDASETVLLDDIGEQWIFGAPSVSPDERHVAIALSSAHPDILAGRAPARGYTIFPDHRLRLVCVPLDGNGEMDVLYEHVPAQSAHCAYCPTDANLLYFDLDPPPAYWNGGDGKTPRIWLLDISTRRVRPLKTHYPGPFQTHQVWLWNGGAIAYHGSLPGGGVYMGIAAVSGETLWERSFPETRHYGHIAADPRRCALIIDGDLSGDLLQWIYRDGRVEPICRHATEWGSIPGQYSHPHPLADPTGRWIAFNAARDGRSDVFAVETVERRNEPQ